MERLPSILTATLDERKRENAKRSQSTLRARRLAEGACVACGGKRDTYAQKCRPCTEKASQAHWRCMQGKLKGGHAPRQAPVSGWNFDTDELIVDHVQLAKQVARGVAARQFSSSTVDVDELIGDALLGLVVAGRTFDESYGQPFGAWATTQIKGEIYRGIRQWTKCRHKEPPVLVPLDDADEA